MRFQGRLKMGRHGIEAEAVSAEEFNSTKNTCSNPQSGKFVRKKEASLFCSHMRGGWGEAMKTVKNKQLPVTEGTPMAALYIGWAFGSLWRTAAMQAID